MCSFKGGHIHITYLYKNKSGGLADRDLARKLFLIISLLLFVQPTFSQSSSSDITLPSLTGQYDVASTVWHWAEAASESPEHPLEVMAQLWYPGESEGAELTRYRPLGGVEFDNVRHNSFGPSRMEKSVTRAPLIVLCPGRGTNRYFYSGIAEELASNGFAVFAVDIPGLGTIEFPDGRRLGPNAIYQPSGELMAGPYEEVDRFYEPAVSVGIAHLKLGLKRLAELNTKDPTERLTGRLGMSSIGLFGHSLGGRVCGALAGSDSRVVALASMEGVPPRNIRQSGMSAASLMLYSTELPEELALPNIRELFDNRTAEATILRLEGFGHNSVTDLPLIYPDRFNYSVDALRALDIVRSLLVSFFDAHLNQGAFIPSVFAEMSEITVIETSID